LKYQSLSEHVALINGFDTELSFYQHALAMLQLPKFLPEVQILENFELHSEQVKVALILKDVPSLLMANPHQLSRDHVIH
ncbi:serine/threonine protein kinase, partial [bacterium LRH843]|nr:serine/threonine protein kinase [bacterium LRH843]